MASHNAARKTYEIMNARPGEARFTSAKAAAKLVDSGRAKYTANGRGIHLIPRDATPPKADPAAIDRQIDRMRGGCYDWRGCEPATRTPHLPFCNTQLPKPGAAHTPAYLAEHAAWSAEIEANERKLMAAVSGLDR